VFINNQTRTSTFSVFSGDGDKWVSLLECLDSFTLGLSVGVDVVFLTGLGDRVAAVPASAWEIVLVTSWDNVSRSSTDFLGKYE
jgi:hypothetical protein